MIPASFHGRKYRVVKCWNMTQHLTELKSLVSGYAPLPPTWPLHAAPPHFRRAYILLSLWDGSVPRYQALSFIALGTGCRRIMTIIFTIMFTSSACFMSVDLTWNPLPWKSAGRTSRKEATVVECFYNKTRDPGRFFTCPKLSVSKVYS